MIDFTDSTIYLGLALGWLLGFVQYAAVAGTDQCVPELLYTLESAVLV